MIKHLFHLTLSACAAVILAAACQAVALEEEIVVPAEPEKPAVSQRATVPYTITVNTESTRVSYEGGVYAFKSGDKLHVVGVDRADIVGDLTQNGEVWSGELTYNPTVGELDNASLTITLVHADNPDISTYGTAIVGSVRENSTLLRDAVELYSLFTAENVAFATQEVTLHQKAAFLDVTVEFDFDGSHIIDAGEALVDLKTTQREVTVDTDFYEKPNTNGEDFLVHFMAVIPGDKKVSDFTLTVGDRKIEFSNPNLELTRNKKYTVNRTIEFHPQVGDPFWSDGTYGRLRHPDSQEHIVGIVVYVNHHYTDSDKAKIDNAITEEKYGFGHGLVMALKNVTVETNGVVEKGFKWCKNDVANQQCTEGLITNPNQTMYSPYFSGFDNTKRIVTNLGNENDSAASLAKNYTYDGIAVSTTSTTGWFLPSIGQWMYTISEEGFGGADPASEWKNGNGRYWLKYGYEPDSGGNLGDLVFVKKSEDSRPEENVLVKSLNDRLAQFFNEFGVSYDTFGDPSTGSNISDNYWTSTEFAADKAIRMNLGTVEKREGVYYSTIKAKGESKTISYYTYNSNQYKMKVRPFLAF